MEKKSKKMNTICMNVIHRNIIAMKMTRKADCLLLDSPIFKSLKQVCGKHTFYDK